MEITKEMTDDEVRYLIIDELLFCHNRLKTIIEGDINPNTVINATKVATIVLDNIANIYGLSKLELNINNTENISNIDLLNILGIATNDKKRKKSLPNKKKK